MFKISWKSYFKNNEKNTWKFTKKPQKIIEFCLSEKVGTLLLECILVWEMFVPASQLYIM